MNAKSTSLSQYIPEKAVPVIKAYLEEISITLKIAPPRGTKLGDYRPPTRHKPHRISVNNNLNSYAFLLTLVHEIAHAYTYEQYGRKAAPHGREWKNCFGRLMQPFLNTEILPAELISKFSTYLASGRATSCADTELTVALKKYDPNQDNRCFISELPYNKTFRWKKGRQFVKLKKLRKRYRCKELETDNIYLFSPVAEVEPVDDNLY